MTRFRDDDAADFFREARHDLTGPLDGVRVLEITSTWAGPRCGCLLADYGADVVKIELLNSPDVAHRLPPFLEHADPPVSFFDAAVNRNKRNMALDLTSPKVATCCSNWRATPISSSRTFDPDGWPIGDAVTSTCEPSIPISSTFRSAAMANMDPTANGPDTIRRRKPCRA